MIKIDLWVLTAAFMLVLLPDCLYGENPNYHRSSIQMIKGYGDASCLNPDSKFLTPNLDKLGTARASRLTNGHSSDTVCTPSRYGLLTGRYCWRTSKKAGVMQAEGDCLIADGRMTLPSMLRDHGYDTAMVGKWHLGMGLPPELRKPGIGVSRFKTCLSTRVLITSSGFQRP